VKTPVLSDIMYLLKSMTTISLFEFILEQYFTSAVIFISMYMLNCFYSQVRQVPQEQQDLLDVRDEIVRCEISSCFY